MSKRDFPRMGKNTCMARSSIFAPASSSKSINYLEDSPCRCTSAHTDLAVYTRAWST